VPPPHCKLIPTQTQQWHHTEPTSPASPRSKFYGASLGAYRAAAEEAGYSIIWVVPHDVYFVRNDILEGVTDVQPFEHWKRCTELPIHHPTAYEDAPFAEYHTYMRTGDAAAAAEAAQAQMRDMQVDLQSVDG
jgi:hypothetical protein